MRMYKIPRWYRIMWVIIELCLIDLFYGLTVVAFILYSRFI